MGSPRHEGAMRIRLLAASLTVALHLALGMALSWRSPRNEVSPPRPITVTECRLLDPLPETEATTTATGEWALSRQQEKPLPQERITAQEPEAPVQTPPRTARAARQAPPGQPRSAPPAAEVHGPAHSPPHRVPATPAPRPPPDAAAATLPVAKAVVTPLSAGEGLAGKDTHTTPATAPSGSGSHAGPATGKPHAAPMVTDSQPLYREAPKPPYPPLARRLGYQGTVELLVLVAKDGGVAEARLARSSGYALLDKTAMTTVRGWRFTPGTREGGKVAMWIKIPVTFSLR